MNESGERLRRHCYRMTGSFAAAEAVVAEANRRSDPTPEEAAAEAVVAEANRRSDPMPEEAAAEADGAVTATRFRLATGCALELIAARDQRQILLDQLTMAEPTWLEPYPTGRWTVGGPPASETTDSESAEVISVSYVIGLQLLSPRQRAALLLGDVVKLPPDEVASAIGVGPGALVRVLDAARFTMSCHRDEWPEPPNPQAHSILADTFAARWQAGAVSAVGDLLADDVILLVPSESLTIHGSRGVMAQLSALTGGRLSALRLVEVELNGRKASAAYRSDGAGAARPFGFFHLDVAGRVITRLTIFDDRLFGPIGLPPHLDR